MINIDNTGLIIIDVQGNLAEQMHDKTSLFKHTAMLINGASLLSLPIIWVEQLPEKLGGTHADIAKHLAGKAFAKSSFSALGSAEIKQAIELADKTDWIVSGIEAHICVYQTARDLMAMNLKVHIATDAVSSRTKENKALGIDAMQAAGAKLTGTEMALFELQQKAEGDTFKKLIKLVK
jgi:nicotinamidase-related amidase